MLEESIVYVHLSTWFGWHAPDWFLYDSLFALPGEYGSVTVDLGLGVEDWRIDIRYDSEHRFTLPL
jgi:hypothetical protein